MFHDPGRARYGLLWRREPASGVLPSSQDPPAGSVQPPVFFRQSSAFHRFPEAFSPKPSLFSDPAAPHTPSARQSPPPDGGIHWFQSAHPADGKSYGRSADDPLHIRFPSVFSFRLSKIPVHQNHHHKPDQKGIGSLPLITMTLCLRYHFIAY